MYKLNNLVYAWGNRATHFESRSSYAGTMKLSVVGNFYKQDWQVAPWNPGNAPTCW